MVPALLGGAALLGGLGLLGAGAEPADAHPFGPPPTAEVTAEGEQVRIHWRAAADDVMAVGAEAGLVDEDVVDDYLEVTAPGQGSDELEERLAASPELAEHLHEHLRVAQDGQRCPASVDTDAVVWEGATLTADCPETITEVDITVSLLHERHPAYRTFAIAPTEAEPAHAVLTEQEPTVTWDLAAVRGEDIAEAERAALADSDPEATTTSGSLALLWPIAGLLALVGAASGLAAWLGRRSPSARGAP